MNSDRLSARSKQPGDDRTFEQSESRFITVARKVLSVSTYEVVEKPSDLLSLFPARISGERALGVQLEAKITNIHTRRFFYVEVKKQGDAGNADERAAKHHTVQFYLTMNQKFGFKYHPIVTVFCEALAVNPRYTRKAPYFFETNQYFNWVDYDTALLSEYLQERCKCWLDETSPRNLHEVCS